MKKNIHHQTSNGADRATPFRPLLGTFYFDGRVEFAKQRESYEEYFLNSIPKPFIIYLN